MEWKCWKNAYPQKENRNELDKPTKIRKTGTVLKHDNKDTEDRIKKYLPYQINANYKDKLIYRIKTQTLLTCRV